MDRVVDDGEDIVTGMDVVHHLDDDKQKGYVMLTLITREE